MATLMSLESRLGITRGDITIALFLSFTALAGFVYTTWFDDRPPARERRELTELVHRHDSIVAAQRDARLKELTRQVASTKADTVAEWQPLRQADAERDNRAEKAERPSSGSGGKKVAPPEPIDINTASRETLMQLPGVGEKTAEGIIAHRSHIPFRRPEDIMEVKGIGQKKFEKMKRYIVVR